MGPDAETDPLERLQAATAVAQQRFAQAREAFRALERAHERGDYSPSPDFQRRLQEFHEAASEVHRLATQVRSRTDSHPDTRGIE